MSKIINKKNKIAYFKEEREVPFKQKDKPFQTQQNQQNTKKEEEREVPFKPRSTKEEIKSEYVDGSDDVDGGDDVDGDDEQVDYSKKQISIDHDFEDEKEDKEEMPELEEEIPVIKTVSQMMSSIKERHEYKPTIRTEIVYVLPEDRRTSEVMTRFEYCEVVSIRAKQIENGASAFIEIGGLTDPLEIAREEVKQKQCPLSIIRMLTDKIGEKWHVNELAIPFD